MESLLAIESGGAARKPAIACPAQLQAGRLGCHW